MVMPSWYLPFFVCSSMPACTSVPARRCTVLFASPKRAASAPIPSALSVSLKLFNSSMALATEDRRDAGSPFRIEELCSFMRNT